MRTTRTSYSSQDDLRRDRFFRCELCHYTSSRWWHVKRHQLTHTGEKPVKCHLCPMTFALKQTADHHIKNHAKRLYQCKLCPRNFVHQRGLKNHEVWHKRQELKSAD
ncbi:protein krueppel [Rhipicephalus sanguineus]|uniref:C2H2-type domain-containing protein n=1 Tax=Rhipicephalus sanguineus TaxID=34632 RepID=A0A9D4QBW6_RHISA|nr:protein krueppel [Rhipicephalus sanguineus]KAH7975421.1 hypothetical protein HPB52_001725 [Rhipicephalus sanguineus]